MNENFGETYFIQADISRTESVEQLFNEIFSKFDCIDIACNNAATDQGALGAFTADISESDFDIQINTNLKGAWLCMKQELKQMLKQGSGSIINVSSINGLGGTVGAAAYSAAKHGLIGLSKSAALEYAKSGIRVNVVCPGMIHTEMLERVMNTISPGNISPVKEHFESNIPLNRIGKPGEIADAVYWLGADNSSFITGHTLIIDGGMTSQFR